MRKLITLAWLLLALPASAQDFTAPGSLPRQRALGAVSATSINKVTITPPANGSTLTVADGKTLTASNSITLTGTDGISIALGATSDTVATLARTQTYTGSNNFNAAANNITIGGNTTPQIVFSPSAGATVTSEFYQTGDTWYVATPGIGNDFWVNLTSPFSAGTTGGGFNVGTQADPGAGTLNVKTAWKNNTVLMISATAPTISAGFCATSPSISASNGTAAFDINVGTACAGSVGTLGMPTATTGWVCSFQNVTNPASNVIGQTGGATNTVTLTNYSRTTGAATNGTASDHIRAMCMAY